VTYPFKLQPGVLHEKLDIPAGNKIPLSVLRRKLSDAKREGDLKFQREVQFALNARQFRHRH